MSDVMLGLGPYRFTVSGLNYQKLQRTSRYRWEAQNRIGRAPAQQFLGAGEEEISIEGVIYPHYRGGFGQLQRMRQDAKSGPVYLIATGYGERLGRYCIVGITDEMTHFHKSGAPLKVTFQIQVKNYGEDGLGVPFAFGVF